jgi:hypothetical protein
VTSPRGGRPLRGRAAPEVVHGDVGRPPNSGVIKSYGDNAVDNNTTNGTPTAPNLNHL